MSATGGTCCLRALHRLGDKRAGQGPSTRFGRAGSLTANELRNRVSPTHSPQHTNAPTEPTSIIAADQRRDGRRRDCPNPLRGSPR